MRILALLALALPGLLLSGAVHLCVCLGVLLGSEGPCATANADCCERFDGDSALEAAESCSDCCIVLDVEDGPPIAPTPEPVSGPETPQIAAVPSALAPPPQEGFAAPARAAPPGCRPPGRAPIPLRI
jgi:hypothetical protein